MTNGHTRVVAVFNELGYQASFAAVARKLPRPKVSAQTLYLRYPRREALGEAWLTAEIPASSAGASLHQMFADLPLTLLRNMQSHRDFSRAWLAAVRLTAPLHLPQLLTLHDQAHQYFVTWLESNQKKLGLPVGVTPRDVISEIADALCAAALLLVSHWETDRTGDYARTRELVDAVGYLFEALLIKRKDFNHNSLLFYLHRMLDLQHGQFIKPVLDMLLKPERAQRLADPVNLVEALRHFRLPSPPS